MDNVSILNDICLPLLPELASRFDRTERLTAFAEIVEILVSDNFGLYETALEITVDDAGGLGCQSALLYNPTANFFLAGCVKLA